MAKKPRRNIKPLMTVLLTLLAGGIAVRFQREAEHLRFELEIGKPLLSLR
jgi:hypothetical protein